MSGKFCIENIEISLKKHQGNEYDMNNTIYRKKFKNRLGDEKSVSPTFQGGGFKNCNDFLLPKVESIEIKS